MNPSKQTPKPRKRLSREDLSLWKERLRPLPSHPFSANFETRVVAAMQTPSAPLMLDLRRRLRPALLLAASLVLLILGLTWHSFLAPPQAGSTDLGVDQDLALMLSWEEPS